LKVILINDIYSEYRITFIFLSILVKTSTTIELCIKENVPKNRNKNEEKNNLKKLLTAFSVIKNTKNLFSSKKDNYQSIHTLFFLFIIWIYVGRYYFEPLTVNLIGFKRVLNSFMLKVISDK
jgi:hypothetical protein